VSTYLLYVLTLLLLLSTLVGVHPVPVGVASYTVNQNLPNLLIFGPFERIW
jgi:hypothetical protein